MAVSGYIAGAASDSLIKAGYSFTPVRKIMQSIGFIGPGVSLLCLNFAKIPVTAAMFITAALSLSSFSQAGFLLNIQDIAPQYAGFSMLPTREGRDCRRRRRTVGAIYNEL
ncbi:hypothetical protein MANES_08G087511v8 [Manihot esculenta]|uniref:Uncharacterized protein n=1 Tax=Manihot esculenta TaxID=3983 RepID=A0ACB7HA78_MANES|nr:hypothetical protein MANES_08G087511v8 [Manihot esculenta]